MQGVGTAHFVNTCSIRIRTTNTLHSTLFTPYEVGLVNRKGHNRPNGYPRTLMMSLLARRPVEMEKLVIKQHIKDFNRSEISSLMTM